MDTIEAVRTSGSRELLSKLPSRLHHNAFVVKDHEVNRRFFEDLLGIPLVATWCEKNFSAELQREVEFCHTFFAMADGGALAFFQFADPELYEMTQAKQPAEDRPLRPHRVQGRARDLRGTEAPPRRGRREIPRNQSRLLQIDLCRLARRADRRIHPGPGRRRRDRRNPPRRRAQRTRPLAQRRPPHEQRIARPAYLTDIAPLNGRAVATSSPPVFTKKV